MNQTICLIPKYARKRPYVHKNSTQWSHQVARQRRRQCVSRGPACLRKVDETPKGWCVQYIDRDPETIRHQEVEARKKKHDEEPKAKFIQEHVRRGQDGREPEEDPVCTEPT